MSINRIERRIRWYQQPFHSYLLNTPAARAIEVAHRRWGKDEVVLSATCELAHKRIGSYWHCLPEYNQGRKAIWTALNGNTGKRRIDEAFPPEIRENTNDTEMFIRLKCGSTWQVIGSDRYDATVGAGPVGIAYSEWALANPSAWAYHRPMLEENGGWAAFITTPRGRNHAKAMYDMAVSNPRWFAETSTIRDTGALSPEQVEESLAEYIALYGEDVGRAQFEQEYYCSFNAAILGAFYAREMLALRNSGRIRDFDHWPDVPVHTAWDIGTRDDTSIWWFQVFAGQTWILDCHTASGAGVDVYADICHNKDREYGWTRGVDYVPHDAKVKTFQSKYSSAERFIKGFGAERVRIVPQSKKQDQINAARVIAEKCRFHRTHCKDGLNGLRSWSFEYDAEKKIYSKEPAHDWASHPGDAFAYGCQVMQTLVTEAPPPKGKTIHNITLDELYEHHERDMAIERRI